MTFYNLPGVEAKLDFDSKTNVLRVTGISYKDRVITTSRNGEQEELRIEFDCQE